MVLRTAAGRAVGAARRTTGRHGVRHDALARDHRARDHRWQRLVRQGAAVEHCNMLVLARAHQRRRSARRPAGQVGRQRRPGRHSVSLPPPPPVRPLPPIESRNRLSHIDCMRVTTWAEYGLIVSLNLAKRAGQGPVAARELAELERLPHDYVEQILLRLRRAGLVDSVRGAKGGYHLARDPQSISVKDVVEASEHVTFEVNCDLHPVDPQRCSPDASCSIRPVWRMLEQRINELLASISLVDLTHDEPELYHIAGALAGN